MPTIQSEQLREIIVGEGSLEIRMPLTTNEKEKGINPYYVIMAVRGGFHRPIVRIDCSRIVSEKYFIYEVLTHLITHGSQQIAGIVSSLESADTIAYGEVSSLAKQISEFNRDIPVRDLSEIDRKNFEEVHKKINSGCVEQ
jgi:hypothetical protein